MAATRVVIKDLPHKTYNTPTFVPHTSKEDKMLKKGGSKHTLIGEWFPPGRIGFLREGSVFEECVDGYFRVVNHEGVELHYRVGAKIISEIFKG